MKKMTSVRKAKIYDYLLQGKSTREVAARFHLTKTSAATFKANFTRGHCHCSLCDTLQTNP
jgi:transposase